MRQTNGTLLKRCDCPDPKKSKCAHPYHLIFWWLGKRFPVSLDRHLSKAGDTRDLDVSKLTVAQSVADEVKQAIRRDGEYLAPTPRSTARKAAAAAAAAAGVPLTIDALF